MPIATDSTYAGGVKPWLAALTLTLTWSALACDSARRPGGTGTPTVRRDATIDAGEVGRDAEPPADGGGTDALPGSDAPAAHLDAQPSPDAPAFPDARAGDPDAQPAPDAAPPFDGGIADAGLPPVEGTIGDVRTGIIGLGTNVTLRDVVVTAFHDEAARQDTIWVQDTRGGTRNAGIKVFIRGPHTAFRDARVDVTGVVTDYFGETEINNATVVSRGTTTALGPIALTIAEASTEEREGMLVQLTDAFSVTYPYSCAVDDVMCTDTRLWEVGGPGGILVFDYAYEDLSWDGRVGASPVTGVMTWRYGRRRIMPRTDVDLPF